MEQKREQPARPLCKGIPRRGCNYLAPSDTPCNKCGEIHHHHQMVAQFEAAQQPEQEQATVKESLTTGEQPEQEPVAWQVHPFDYGIGHEGVYAITQLTQQRDSWIRKGWKVTPLYTHPPRREWRSLSEEEMKDLWAAHGYKSAMCKPFARAFEAALRSKNHD
jgi:hypothetical protein